MSDPRMGDNVIAMNAQKVAAANRRHAYEIGHTDNEAVRAESYDLFVEYTRWLRVLHDAGCPLIIEAHFYMDTDDSGKPMIHMTPMDLDTSRHMVRNADSAVRTSDSPGGSR
jgi:hypothetical protein